MNSPIAVEDRYAEIQDRRSQIPNNYLSSSSVQVDTAGSIDPFQIYELAMQAYMIAPLWHIFLNRKKIKTFPHVKMCFYFKIEDGP